MTDPFITETENKESCPYCARQLEGCTWHSVFDPQSQDKHYKTTFCDCGRQVWVNAGWLGSGHDSWDSSELERIEAKKTLESRITIVPPKIQVMRQ